MKLALFGGSFDPIHRGHIDPIREAQQKLGLDRVVFLPTAQPPHKVGRVMAPPLARYAMVELALLREADFVVSPLELSLGRPAYTAETLEHFARQEPSAELFLILGSDSFADLPNWVRWRDITRRANLVVVRRLGWEAPVAVGGASEELAELVRAGSVSMPEISPCGISSTQLRTALANGERPPAGWLPDLVLEFIHKYNLYR